LLGDSGFWESTEALSDLIQLCAMDEDDREEQMAADFLRQEEGTVLTDKMYLTTPDLLKALNLSKSVTEISATNLEIQLRTATEREGLAISQALGKPYKFNINLKWSVLLEHAGTTKLHDAVLMLEAAKHISPSND
jgi:hypothetical protein